MESKWMILAIIGGSAGLVVSAGILAFLSSLGILSDFASRTHTEKKIRNYEYAAALGGAIGVVGTFLLSYAVQIPFGRWLLPFVGLCFGIFSGCWAIALAEVVKIFPIFFRRVGLSKELPGIITAIALGKTIGGWLYFLERW